MGVVVMEGSGISFVLQRMSVFQDARLASYSSVGSGWSLEESEENEKKISN